MKWLMDHSDIILTDSSGIQEEGPVLGKLVLLDSAVYRAMSHAHNPYGDGHAVSRIIEALRGIKQV